MPQENNITLAGKIETQEVKGKLKFYGFNHQRGKRLHIGTLIGATYEKVAVVLRQPEASLCLSQTEHGALQDAGGLFVRFIVDKAQTYSISLTDFTRNAGRFYNAGYGYQLRVSLRHFAFSNTVAKRNAQTDNPRIASGALTSLPIHKIEQLSLFGGLTG